VSQVSVQDPQGKMRDYPVQGNPWIFTDTHQVGVYIFRAGESKHYLTVNLLDDAESDINPADKLPPLTPGTAEGGLQQAGTVETPLWVVLLLGAVVVVFGEWYAWCRDF
jgi:hypothetical protein